MPGCLFAAGESDWIRLQNSKLKENLQISDGELQFLWFIHLFYLRFCGKIVIALNLTGI